jgi:hypothetical protein
MGFDGDVCGATVDMPAQEALIDAKTRLEPYLREEIHVDPTSVKWVVDQKLLQLTQEHLPQETYPIWATVLQSGAEMDNPVTR